MLLAVEVALVASQFWPPLCCADGQSNEASEPSAPASMQVEQSSQSQGSDKKRGSKKRLINLGASSSAFNLGTSENMIAWEKWHKTVGKALHKKVEGVSRMSLGEVVLLVTVNKDLQVTAIIVEASNMKLAEACLGATQSLSGDTLLLFPAESKRNFIRFRFEYKRGFFFIPKNHYITDDFERVEEPSNPQSAPNTPSTPSLPIAPSTPSTPSTPSAPSVPSTANPASQTSSP